MTLVTGLHEYRYAFRGFAVVEISGTLLADDAINSLIPIKQTGNALYGLIGSAGLFYFLSEYSRE